MVFLPDSGEGYRSFTTTLEGATRVSGDVSLSLSNEPPLQGRDFAEPRVISTTQSTSAVLDFIPVLWTVEWSSGLVSMAVGTAWQWLLI